MAKIPGVGMLTATYVVAAVGNARQFSTAKQFASWLGLTPKEHSSGGKQQLGGISKRGDGYFRYLLVHGARALTAWVNRNGAVEKNSWLQGLLERKHYNVAVVAMAAKQRGSCGQCCHTILNINLGSSPDTRSVNLTRC